MAKNIHDVDRDRCSDLEAGLHLEWLVTNGRGGFAMATVSQMLTRRYHGLLVAAIDPPVERFVLLAKLDTVVRLNDQAYELATNHYTGVIHPHGYRHLESFTARPYPRWRWRTGDALIEQSLCMAEGEDTTFVRYHLLEGDGPVTLSVRPLCTSRHFHMLAQSLDLATPSVDVRDDRLSFRWSEHRPSWRLTHNGTFATAPDWYYQFLLATEEQRGYDANQDLFCPGTITAELHQDDATGLIIAASTQDRPWQDADQTFAQAALQDRDFHTQASEEDPLLEPLLRATKDFLVVRDADLKTVIAGYPWFGDWGRDTFISLPGLCLVPGRFDDARRVLEAFAQYVDGGMIPNRFPDFGEAPAYNTVDATLWYVHAIDRYLAYSGDWDFIARRMFAVIADIIEAHERGTRHGIRACEDGLLAAGDPGLALTWMDAQLPDRSITPRAGKPVEINALWHNALRIALSYAERLGKKARADRWRGIAGRAHASFNERFWNESCGCLFDVIDVDGIEGATDRSIRPNQLFAISLTHPVLDAARRRTVVDVCRQRLLTPMGLRTLAPTAPAYRGQYGGDLASRDTAYHQGTVWPWLLGPFVTAFVRAFGDTEVARAEAAGFLHDLVPHLGEAGIGGISEVADGNAPHTPGGCPWQAWSIAEPLRALCEDVLKTHPEPRRDQPSLSKAWQPAAS